MGKMTEAQLREQVAANQRRVVVQKNLARRIEKEEVRIQMVEGDDLVFEGDYEAQLTPTGVVCIVELVPDLLGQNKGDPIPVIREFVNTRQWTRIILK